MYWPLRIRSLLAQFTLRTIVPLTLVMVVTIAAGVYAYQRTVSSLLIARDQQLAEVVASRLSETLAGYARVLQTLASTTAVSSGSLRERQTALSQAAGSLSVFSGGVALVAANGSIVTSGPAGPWLAEADLQQQLFFQTILRTAKPAFSNILAGPPAGRLIIVGVPVNDNSGNLWGALLGAVNLANAPLSQPLEQTRIGEAGIVYLVDGTGRVIFHPDQSNIGADFTDRPFVTNVIHGESGGTLWSAPTGERLVLGYTPVSGTGWGLIVREPWDSVVRPVQDYALAMVVVAATTFILVLYFLWLGVRQIATPVRLLAEQTRRLAAGESTAAIPSYGVDEIDALDTAFGHMAAQIESYRAGLRRYVGAMTQAQENDRRRIARELHDESIQSLLTMTRQIELLQSSRSEPVVQGELEELKQLANATVQGLRRTTQDLRPIILDDLGLVSGLRALVRLAREGQGAIPTAEFDVTGQPRRLTSEQELAVYRITQEALTNIRKHARATGLAVLLAFETGQVQLSISDDGQGFEVPEAFTHLAQQDHFGLMGIQERVWAVGGTLTVQSKPGEGTLLTVIIPTGI